MNSVDSPGSPAQRIAHLKAEITDIVLDQMATVGPDLAFIDLKVMMTSTVGDVAMTATKQDGSAPPLAPDPRLEPLFRELRHLQYDPDQGAWFSALVTNDAEMRLILKLNYDVDPIWYPELPGSAFRRDLEDYPRGEGYIPTWLADKIAESD
ncbi:hypothetical protein [Nocardia sp. NPDC048505]|uniref:hypothetical protein n=1 Tax=unclassified Nocardia TaxID=2637762 RepID=UPI0033DE0E03